MKEIGFGQTRATPILEDNEAAIKLAKNPIKAGKTKHIDVHHHFIRQSIKNNDIVMVPVDTTLNPADLGTKSLGRTKFERFRDHVLGDRIIDHSGLILAEWGCQR